MKLYYSPGVCSLAPHIALREAGLNFDLVKVDLGSKETSEGGSYLSINPKGYVPALSLDDGQILTEVPAVLQWIADRRPSMGLAPANGTMERYRLQACLNFIATELHKSYGLFFVDGFPEDAKDLTRRRIAARLGYIEESFVSDYLCGSRFGIADAYLFVVLSWNRMVGIDIKGFRKIQAYIERIAGRPKVRDALEAEGLA